MAEFESIEVYVQSPTSLLDKIARIDAVIDGLLLTASKAASNDGMLQYTLDTGQSKQTVMYRGAEAVMRSVEQFERLKQLYINRLNNDGTGRVNRLVDRCNFK